MLFNSMSFLIFFPAVLAVYFLLPASLWQGGARRYWLLVASYYFYMSWNPRYALLMAFSTLVTYVSGLALAAWGRMHLRGGESWWSPPASSSTSAF